MNSMSNHPAVTPTFTKFENGMSYILALSRKKNCFKHGHVTPQIKGNFMLITNIGIENRFNSYLHTL